MDEENTFIQWMGCKIKSEQSKEHLDFYESVLYKDMRISVGDHVIIMKETDSSRYDSDVAKIKHLYEASGTYNDEKYRAIVEWYSRPKEVLKYFKNAELDLDNEVVLDLRPFDDDVNIETIYKKCDVLLLPVGENPADVKNYKSKLTTYVCRYTIRRIFTQTKFSVVPVLEHLKGIYDNEHSKHLPMCSNLGGRKSTPRRPTAIQQNLNSPRTPKRKSLMVNMMNSPRINETPKRTRTPSQNENRVNKTAQQWSIKRKSTSQTIQDITNKDYRLSPEIPIVSPIKLVNSAALLKNNSNLENKKLSLHDISQELDSEDELEQKLNKKKLNVRRNLNDSLKYLKNEIESDEENENIQYSVILNENEPNKIKLRVSDDSLPIQRSKRNKSHKMDSSIDSLMSSDESLNCQNFDVNVNLKSSIVKLEKMNLEDMKKNIESSQSKKQAVKSSSRVCKINSKYFSKDYISPTKGMMSPKVRTKKNNKIDSKKKESDMYAVVKLKKIEDLQVTPKKKKEIIPKSPCTTPGMRLKQFKAENMTPTLQARDTPGTPSRGLSLARERLHVSAVPKSLPCRETEFNDVFTFVQGKLLDQSGGCMYISGVPGTGKTATVTEVIKCLQKLSKEKKLPKFEFIEVNGMRLTEPRQAYVHIYRQMEDKTVPWEQALAALDKKFTTSAKSRLPTVLLVDELDILCTKRQDVVYTILDWPSKANAKLIVITIANTMDLPERLLRAKVTSRLGLTRRTFAPYSHKQLMDIVMSRLYGMDLFNSDAVQLVARKVAAVSGDARRALDICRRATEIAEFSESTNSKMVSMVHVNQALAEMITSAKVTAIQNCSVMEKIFLQAVAAEVARTGVEETTFGSCYPHIISLCALEGLPVLSTSTALSICSKLGSHRLLITETGRSDLNMKILLNVGSDDLHYALQDI